jgi:hypothetical protein
VFNCTLPGPGIAVCLHAAYGCICNCSVIEHEHIL